MKLSRKKLVKKLKLIQNFRLLCRGLTRKFVIAQTTMAAISVASAGVALGFPSGGQGREN